MARTGRPRKNSSRSNWVTVRLGDGEKEDLKNLSKILDMSISDTIRYAINKTYVEEDKNQWHYI